MEWIGVIGIVVGLVFFVIAAMKGWNVLITSIVTAIIIALTNGMDIMNSMVGTESSYVTGLAGFIRGNLLIFMGGAIMGEFMDKSGAAKAIAKAVMDKVGTKSPYLVLLGISAIGALLTYAGISMFVAMFALIPLARPMFRECDIPWPLFCAAWTLGTCSFTMAMIPGVPAIAWINAANGCGVSLTAAPLMGIVGSVIAATLGCLIIKFSLKRARAKGEHFEADADDIAVEEDRTESVLGAAPPHPLDRHHHRIVCGRSEERRVYRHGGGHRGFHRVLLQVCSQHARRSRQRCRQWHRTCGVHLSCCGCGHCCGSIGGLHGHL